MGKIKPLKLLKILPLIFFAFLFVECKKSDNYNTQEYSLGNFDEDGYLDGTYCAEIDYYYSETGTSSTYTLLVEIENNELTVIHWPNGGWLDDSHFTPPDISNGETSFTSDEGVEYTVRIIGNEGDCPTSSSAISEDELIQQKEDSEDEEYKKRQDEEAEYQKKQLEEEEEKRKQEEEDRKREEENIE
ncbi:hypothetical protein [Flavobacterium anhuiense]|uniref:hypothetical protein n=1 Tax=Flavobacterium anhuiense TaxID=459526 RepID=UPI000E6C9071|nr:hypothetical protein [Flavobacterium anhuiense]